MIKLMVSVRDVKAKIFHNPFYANSEGFAFRAISDEIKRGGEGNLLADHPEDFQLWQVGLFDDESGQVVAEAQAKLLAECSTLDLRRG